MTVWFTCKSIISAQLVEWVNIGIMFFKQKAGASCEILYLPIHIHFQAMACGTWTEMKGNFIVLGLWLHRGVYASPQ